MPSLGAMPTALRGHETVATAHAHPKRWGERAFRCLKLNNPIAANPFAVDRHSKSACLNQQHPLCPHPACRVEHRFVFACGAALAAMNPCSTPTSRVGATSFTRRTSGYEPALHPDKRGGGEMQPNL